MRAHESAIFSYKSQARDEDGIALNASYFLKPVQSDHKTLPGSLREGPAVINLNPLIVKVVPLKITAVTKQFLKQSFHSQHSPKVKNFLDPL